MRTITALFMLLVVTATPAAPVRAVFISFSMPEHLIADLMREASAYEIPVYLNGLIDDDFRKTLTVVFKLSQKYPTLSLQIDPNAFEHYHITEVPALVVANNNRVDVVYGNLTIKDGLQWIARKGGAE